MKNRNTILQCFSILVLLVISAYASLGNSLPKNQVKLIGSLYYPQFGLEGSPYLIDNWQVGNIIIENGKTASEIKMKFNIIKNDLVFYNDSLKRVFSLDKGFVKSFVFYPATSDSMLFVKYTGKELGYKLNANDFVHAVNQGKYNFFVKNTADVIAATDLNSGNKVYPKKYYFLNFNGQTYEIKLNYRSVYNLFPLKKKLIKKLIAENKIRKVSENNMKVLFRAMENNPDI